MATIPGLSQRSVPEEAARKLAPILGHVAISWSFLDQVIEMWVVELGYEAVKRRLVKRISQPLDDRIYLLRRCLTHMPELEKVKAAALEHLAGVEALAAHRHMLTHGTLSHYIAEPEEAIVFVKLRFMAKHGFHVAEQDGYTLTTLEEMSAAARRLTLALQSLKRDVDDLFDDD